MYWHIRRFTCSPQQMNSCHLPKPLSAYDPYAADVWSWAACMYVLACKRLPFTKAHRSEVRFLKFAIATKQSRGLHLSDAEAQAAATGRSWTWPAHFSDEFVLILHRCLNLGASKRPTMKQVLESEWCKPSRRPPFGATVTEGCCAPSSLTDTTSNSFHLSADICSSQATLVPGQTVPQLAAAARLPDPFSPRPAQDLPSLPPIRLPHDHEDSGATTWQALNGQTEGFQSFCQTDMQGPQESANHHEQGRELAPSHAATRL